MTHPPPSPSLSQLHQCEEFVDGESAGVLGEVLIRCNNVLWVRGADADADAGAGAGGGVEAAMAT